MTGPSDEQGSPRSREAAEAIATDAGRRADAMVADLCRAIAGLAHVEPGAVRDLVAEFDQAMDGEPTHNATLMRLRTFALSALDSPGG